MRRSTFVCLVLSVSLGPVAHGQGFFRISRPYGSVGASFSQSWSSSGGETATSQGLGASLSIATGGFIVHPRIMRFTLGIAPGGSRQSEAFRNESRRGKQEALSYHARMTVLSDFPLTASFAGRRTSRQIVQTGGVTEDRSADEEFTARIGYTNPYLPVSLDISRTQRERRFLANSIPGTPSENRVTSATLDLSNSKMSLRLNRLRVENRTDETRFGRYSVDFSHALRWGKGSSIGSSLGFARDEFPSTVKHFRWAEFVQLQHTSRLSTSYSYAQSGVKKRDRSVSGRSATMSLAYQLGRLSVGASAARTWQDVTAGSQTRNELRPRLSWSVISSRLVSVALQTNLGYQSVSSQTSDGRAPVVDEPHVVPASRRFALDQPFVFLNTIVVSNAERTLVFTEGVDYFVDMVGPLAEIVLLPGGRLVEGDAVLVDYEYQAIRGGNFSVLSRQVGTQIRLGRLRLSAGYRDSRTRAREDGEGTFSQGLFREQSSGNVSVNTGFATPIGRLSVGGGLSQSRVDTLTSTGLQVQGTLGFRVMSQVSGVLTGMLLSQSSLGLRTRSTNANVRFIWSVSRFIRADGDLSMVSISRADGSSDRFLSGGVEFEGRLGLTVLEFAFRTTSLQRFAGPTQRSHWLRLTTRRRF